MRSSIPIGKRGPVKAVVVNTVGGFWPIGVFFAGYRSFLLLFLVDKLRRKHAFKHANKKKLARIAAGNL